MKIAYLVGDFPSLSETFILNQITGLIDRGCQIDIYGHKPTPTAKIHACVLNYRLLEHTYYYEALPHNYVLRLLKALLLYLKHSFTAPLLLLKSLNVQQFGRQALSLRLFYAAISCLDHKATYDVIHCHFGHNGLLGMNLRTIGALQGKIITTFHARDITQKLSELGEHAYDQLFLESQLILPISQHWQAKLYQLGCSAHKIQVHHMGIDCQKFTFIPRQYNQEGTVNIISVARLVEKKGIEYGIRSIQCLKRLGYQVHYLVIGDGDLYDDLRQLIIDLNLDEEISLLGWKSQDELLEMMNSAHIFFAPSVTSAQGDQEGIPVALMEAMAMGLPVVSTQHSGIPELVDQGISGYLAPERDVKVLAEQIAHLIDESEDWPKIGRAGRLKVETDFNIDQLNAVLYDLCKNLKHCRTHMG
ncbi:glycosyltransferase [Acaryochloris sp. IP29b_bin.137]|uniref:glycosyltransferase n=1 Tax=Acaryochloris sp. IP29b_bin.137 TaxID=2969217 RepID=UPI00261F5537|nr:glycosyltransferase [Acaryochloris sp. IP29b_bin.137]